MYIAEMVVQFMVKIKNTHGAFTPATALAVILILAVCAVGGYFLLSNDDKGVSGTYTYTASGTNAAKTETYSGTWALTFDNGRIVDSRMDVYTTIQPSVTSTTPSDSGGVDLTKPSIQKYNSGSSTPPSAPRVPQIDDDKKTKANNSMINGTYYGKNYVETANGTMYLKTYGLTYNSVHYTCFCDDDGVIYVFVEGNVTYKLTSRP